MKDARRFFDENALVYASLADLKKAHDRVLERYDWEVSKQQGSLLDDDEEPPALTAESLEKELCLTGCRDDVHRAIAAGETFDEVGDGMYVTPGVPGTIQLDVCDVLPKDGVCSLACDDRAIASLVAPGTCIDFACGLTDGRDLVFKRCLPDAQITN